MKKINILVTGVGGDIGQSVLSCLEDAGNDYNFEISGCDIDIYSAGRKKCKSFFKAPKASSKEEYLDFITTLTDKKSFNYIVPTTEAEIKNFDSYRDYFKKGRVRNLINNSNIINTFFDKYETVNFLRENQLPYPKTYSAEDFKCELSFPLILKQRRGCGGEGVRVVKDLEELDFFRKRLKDIMIQEMLGEDEEEYTAGVFSDGKVVYSICFRRLLGYGSMTKFAELVHRDEITHLLEKIAQLVDLRGSINVQLRKTDQGYIPFEINPRLSSTVYMRNYFGFQDVKWWIDYYEGKPIEYRPSPDKGIMVRTVGNVFFETL